VSSYLYKLSLAIELVLILLIGRSDAAEKTKITIGYSTTGPTAVGLWTAKDNGAFDKYGVDPSLIFISSSPVMVPALIGGDVQAAIAGANAVIAAAINGASIVSIASLANRPYLRLWVHPDINRIEELRGKTFGVSRFGATTDNLTRILLRRVSLENSVNVRQLGGTLEVGLAFRHRQIDAAVLATLRTDVPHRILLELAESGIQYSMGQLVVSRDFFTALAGASGKRHARLPRGCCDTPRCGAEGPRHENGRPLYPLERAEGSGGNLQRCGKVR